MAGERVRKVAAMVLRPGRAGDELLVFDHPLDKGGSMIQVPAGTVEPLEAPRQAVFRELREETGVEAATASLAGVHDEEHEGESRRRWVYLIDAPEGLAAEWPSICDCGAAIRCYWVPFESARIVKPQQSWLDLARASRSVRG